MGERVLLIDFENVGKIEVGAIPADVRVRLFIGLSQKSVPREYLNWAARLGDRFEAIDIAGEGKNALDFHVAFYLGEHLARSPAPSCIVLSKDKGFDPLLKHTRERGFDVRRAATLAEAFPTQPVPSPVSAVDLSTCWDAALALLSGTQKNKLPRKRKGLIAHLSHHFAKKITAADADALVNRMIAGKKVTDNNGAMTYHF
jgi:hypothetical protein